MPPPVQRRANNHNATRPHRHGASRDSSGPSDDLLVALVDVFFDAVYPMPSYAFLHPQITKARCRDRRPAHDALASALCAVAVLYLDSGGTSTGIVAVDRETAASWILAAEQSIWLSLESPTIPRLQTLLLIIHHHMETGHFQRAFMLTATAARFAAAMRLNHERPDLGSIPREVRRRALWSLKIIERYFSVGITEFDLLPLDAIFIDFPGTEEAFMLEGRALQQQDGQGIEEGGAYRLLVRLERIRIDIMKLTRSVASLHKSLPSLVDLVRHRDQVLSGIGSPESLPGGDMCSSGTVDLAGDSWLPRRILAHLSWHQAHCDLYRILLRGYPEAAPDVVLQGTDQAALAAAEQQCLHHASRIIQIVTALNQKSTRHLLLEFDTAICAYHATRLVLFISRFGTSADRPSPEYAASRAALCLAALKRFFPSSALVAPIIRELEQSLQVFSEQRQQRPRQSCRKRKPAGLAPSSVDDQPHQRLAIHSLLRQADFSGNDSESDDETNGETAGQAMTPASMTAAAENRGLREQYEGQPAGLSSSSTENSAPLQIFPGGGEPGLFTPTGTVTATSSRHNTSSTHNMGVGISAYSGGTAFPNFALDAADEWDFSTGSRSALPFQEPGDAVAMATVGDAQHSFFAWWGPQDWDWL